MTVSARQIKCRSMLQGLGASLAGASALTGNFVRESGANLPTVFRTGQLDHGSQGLAQWRLGRLTAYMNYVRVQKADLVKGMTTDAAIDKALWPWYGRLDFQTEFVIIELKEDFPALWAKLSDPSGADAGTLAADVCWQYERPSKALSGISERIAAAKAIAADHSELADIGEPTVVDHLISHADDHEQQAQGGIVAGMFSAFVAAGLFISNYVHDLPRWELVAIVILLAAAACCIVAALASKKKATDIRLAIPQVSAVPKPADKPAPAPVIPSPGPVAEPLVPVRSVVDTSSPEFQAAVREAVAAMQTRPPQPAVNGVGNTGTIVDTAVVKDLPQQTDGTMMIKRAGA